MSLADAYTIATSRIPDLFSKIRDGQAPDQVTQQLLKDWGFQSSNDRAFLPLLKALGFLSPDGKPTSLYHDYRDHSKSKAVMGNALKSAYGDLFLIKAHPTDADRDSIHGKFKSYHNVSDTVASHMARTFLTLLGLADISAKGAHPNGHRDSGREQQSDDRTSDEKSKEEPTRGRVHSPALHYNIQIHLPATKDVEVYNSIFKSLKEHLFDK